MTVSYENSKTVFEGIKAAGIESISALPETWLGLLLQRAEDDSEVRNAVAEVFEPKPLGDPARRALVVERSRRQQTEQRQDHR